MARPFLVGVAGGSCSGKSTFAAMLAEVLGPTSCGVVNMDRYHRHNEGPTVTLSDGEVFANYNHPDSTDHPRAILDIAEMKEPVVIVEGLMVLHLDSLRELLNLKIFVETDAPTRAVRRMIRSKERSPDQTLEWIGRYYLECAVPGHDRYVQPSRQQAHLTVSGNSLNAEAVHAVAEGIRRSLEI